MCWFASTSRNRRSGRPTLISAFFVARAILHLPANLRDACPLRAVRPLTKSDEPFSRRYMHSNMTLYHMTLCRSVSGVQPNGGNGISVSDLHLQRSGIQMMYIVSKFSCGPTQQEHLEAWLRSFTALANFIIRQHIHRSMCGISFFLVKITK